MRDMCVGMGDLLFNLRLLLDALVVLPQNMAANLQRTQGMIMSEAMTFALAERMGKHTAHVEMQRLTRTARERGCSLQQAASDNEAIRSLLVDRPDLLDVSRYVGRAPQIADAAAATVHR